MKTLKAPKGSSIKLDKYNTLLANANELSTAFFLNDTLGIDNIDIQKEIDINNRDLEDVVSTISGQDRNYLLKAIDIKKQQGMLIAQQLFQNKTIISDPSVIREVVWSNNATKFTRATGQPHDENPSDIVIVYHDSKEHFTRGPWFGVSLKASYSSGEIGQYNGNSCKFSAGIIHSEPNEYLVNYCNQRTVPSEKSIYIATQARCNAIYQEFQDNWCKDNITGWEETESKDDRKALWKAKVPKNAKEEKDNPKKYEKDMFRRASLARTNMYADCIQVFYEELKQYEYVEINENFKILVRIPRQQAITTIASYLRMNTSDIGSEPNYIKAYASTDNVSLELPGVYNYIPEDDNDIIDMMYTKVGGGSLNLSCGGKKSINFRVKLESTPPSAIKINGVNNAFVAVSQNPQIFQTNITSQKQTMGAAEEPEPTTEPTENENVASDQVIIPKKTVTKNIVPNKPNTTNLHTIDEISQSGKSRRSSRNKNPVYTGFGGDGDNFSNETKVMLFTLVQEAVEYMLGGDIEEVNETEQRKYNRELKNLTNDTILSYVNEYKMFLHLTDNYRARNARWLIRQTNYLTNQELVNEVISKYVEPINQEKMETVIQSIGTLLSGGNRYKKPKRTRRKKFKK